MLLGQNKGLFFEACLMISHRTSFHDFQIWRKFVCCWLRLLYHVFKSIVIDYIKYNLLDLKKMIKYISNFMTKQTLNVVQFICIIQIQTAFKYFTQSIFKAINPKTRFLIEFNYHCKDFAKWRQIQNGCKSARIRKR